MTKQTTQPSDTFVVLLHGVLKSSRHMWRLEEAFLQHGYQVQNIDYPSRSDSIEGLSQKYLKPVIDRSTTSTIVLIGYSMGGLLIRHYLSTADVDTRITKVLMLGTPNKGSEVSDYLLDIPYIAEAYKAVFGCSSEQLSTQFMQNANWSLPASIQYGVIAGNKTIDPLSSNIVLPKPNDGKVTVESTKLDIPHAHIVLPVDHMFMPERGKTIKQALSFVESGRFIIQ